VSECLLLDENLSERLLPSLNAATAELLLDQADIIDAFGTHPETGFLVLRFRSPTP
jgi:hypothetical protein